MEQGPSRAFRDAYFLSLLLRSPRPYTIVCVKSTASQACAIVEKNGGG